MENGDDYMHCENCWFMHLTISGHIKLHRAWRSADFNLGNVYAVGVEQGTMTMTIYLLQINVWCRQVCHKLWLNMENLSVFPSFSLMHCVCL